MAKKKKKPRPAKKDKKPAVEKPADQKIKITPYPDAEKPVTDFEKVLDKQLSADKDIGKRARGRPRKDSAAVPKIVPDKNKPDVPLEILQSVLSMPFDLWSTGQKIPALKLNKEEAENLSKAVKPLLDYYLPYIPEIGYAWGSFVATVYWITKPRLEIIAEFKKQKNASSEAAPASPDIPIGSAGEPARENKNFPKAGDYAPQKI